MGNPIMPKSPFSFIKPEMLTDIAEQASKLLPGEKSREEIQRSLQLVMQNALSRLDIVSREEFDAQAAVLQKTRAKVELLETELAILMARLEEQQQ
jgi:ubiquinone biosynthesis accessory factor UbiK